MNLSVPHPKFYTFWVSVLMHWMLFPRNLYLFELNMLEKQQSKDKVYMSVICLKQMIWSLGEDNRVYKLFIFSLSTELIKSAKTMGEQMLSQKTNAPVELLHCLSKKKKNQNFQTPLMQPMKYSTFFPSSIINLNDVGFLPSYCINIS